MKKVFIAGLILTMFLGVAGCGKQAPEEPENRFKPATEKVFGE